MPTARYNVLLCVVLYNYYLDHEVEILWELWGSTHRLQDAEDLGASKVVGFTNTVGITKVDTNE